MTKTLSYDEQEELCYKLLMLMPGLSFKTVASLFEEQFKSSLTRSCFSRAKQRGQETESAPLREKDKYLICLFKAYPNIPAQQVRAKTKMYFGEDTRRDVIEARRQEALTADITSDRAKELLSNFEQKVGGDQGFEILSRIPPSDGLLPTDEPDVLEDLLPPGGKD